MTAGAPPFATRQDDEPQEAAVRRREEPDRQPVARTRPARRRPSTPVLVLCLLHLVASVGLVYGAWLSRFSISNIDGISYLSLARQYAEGSLDTAVNAFWSPALSWAMVPLILAGVPGTLALVLVNAAAGMVGMALGTWLVWRATGRHFWASGIFLVSSALFFLSSLYLFTPDVLVVTWVIAFVATLHWATPAVTDGSPRRVVPRAVVLGAVCAVGYVVKLYLLPVMLVSIPLWLVWAVARRGGRDGRRARAVRAARDVGLVLLVVLVTFSVLAAPWVAALSHKYGGFTLGSSFTVNIEAKFDPMAGEPAPPELRMWEPPNDEAVSYGEDRTFRGSDEPAFVSTQPLGARLEYYVSQRIAAFPHYLDRVASVAPFAAVTVALYLVLLALGRFRSDRFRLPTVAAVVWVVYFAGYAAITTALNAGGSPRYYWPSLLTWLVFVCALVPPFWRAFGAGASPARRSLVIVLVAAVPLSVLWQFGLGRSAPFTRSDGPRGVVQLLRTVPEPGAVRTLATSHLSEIIEPGDRLLATNFRSTNEIAYYLGAQVYGRSAQPYDPADPEFRALLREYDVDYYLYFQRLTWEPEPPDALEKIGPTAGEYVATMPCDDVAAAPEEPCRVIVVEVAP
ncbi:hypothetical protein [Cellulomonas telluris]|uniref:hypothetical protein n=1 Tax=Cellulomonas telluris TaxID=2306636 RepID=UPI0010A8F5DA|nr:hypothetical protein [Cellulomonas telluris]